jgi:hypothetical protein
MGTPYTMSPMALSGRCLLAALSALGLLLSLAACSEEQPESPDTKVGDQIEGRVADLDPGKSTDVLTPAGRLTVSFADAVTRLEKDEATDLTARSAPDGGSFVPVVWSFQDDDIYGEITRLFGDRQPMEVELVTGGESYTLTPPDAGPGKKAEYVAVEGSGDDVTLEVTYNGLTQTLDAETGKLDKGVAKGLYDLPKTKIKIKDCPIKGWFTKPGVFPQYECRYTTAVPSPYVADTWVEKGHTWLSVTVATNLALFATGELNGALASYRVVDNTELSTIGGEKSLGTLNSKVNAGVASGTLVFDILGKLPKKMHLLREYTLTLNGVVGKIDAPEKRKVKIGGDIKLAY